MSDRSTFLDFPGGRWHASNQARERGAEQAKARKGVTYPRHVEIGEIIQLANSSSGKAEGGLLVVVDDNRTSQNDKQPDPPLKLQVLPIRASAKIIFNPAEVFEIDDAQGLRRYAKNMREENWKEITDEIERRKNQQQDSNNQEGNDETPNTSSLKPPTALSLLKDAFKAAVQGRLF